MQLALFATDFSEYADHALQVLPHLKPAGLRRVVLEHSLDEWQFVNWPMAGVTYSAKLREETEAALAERVERVVAMGLEARYRLDLGTPFREIVRAAKEEETELIVMGAQGKALLQELVLGSVSEKVVRQARVPVLLYRFRPLQHDAERRPDYTVRPLLDRILLATDFSDTAHKALQFLVEMTRNTGAEVMLLHVQDERRIRPYIQDMLPDFNRIDGERLASLGRVFPAAGVKVQTRLVTGVPFLDIERVANEWDATMIALGSHGRSALAEVMMGSVSSEVVRMVERPVLVVRR